MEPQLSFGRLRGLFRRGTAGFDYGNDLVDFDLVSFSGLGPQDSRLRRIYFGRDLIGLQRKEDVTGVDGFAVLFMPGREYARGD